MKSEKPLLNCLQNKPVARRPIWLMRQAGRYLPEYKVLRSQASDFINFCLSPKFACEATLQPVDRFDVDGAILFADILLMPLALGQNVCFAEGEGPKLDRLKTEKDIRALSYRSEVIAPVFETVSLVRHKLPQRTTLIGFCGGPWTVACYMLQGDGKGGFKEAIDFARNNPESFSNLLDLLADSSAQYLKGQIEAGAEVVQIFESHAGLLEGEEFKKWVIEPTKIIINNISKLSQVIGFPRGASEQDYIAYSQQTGAIAIGLDQNLSLRFAQKQLKNLTILQGNLDPEVLLAGGPIMEQKAQEIMDALGPHHIFNLGHGVLQQTPPDHVAQLVSFVHGYKGGA